MSTTNSEPSASERQRLQRRKALRTGWTLAGAALLVFVFYIAQVARVLA